MRTPITPEAEDAIVGIARRHGLSREAVLAMLFAVHAGGGSMAQFSIPELGGSGQWMQGGMTMVGNMFDNALKARVEALCDELSQMLTTTTVFVPTAKAAMGSFSTGKWWPAELGIPSSSGGQNDSRYAVFPGARRLAIQISGATKVFDTGEHQIGGVQQQQGGGLGTVMFTSQFGTFAVNSLREVDTDPGGMKAGAASEATTATAASQKSATPIQSESMAGQSSSPSPPLHSSSPSQPPPSSRETAPSSDTAAIISAIESLAGLHQRGILTAEEFAAKKAELLARL